MTDEMWAELTKEGFPRDIDNFRKDISQAVEFVKRRYRQAGVELPNSDDDKTEFLINRRHDRRNANRRGLRQEAVSLLLAEIAREDPALQQFRKRHLRGEVIPWDKAAEWIEAQAAKDGKPTPWRPANAQNFEFPGFYFNVIRYAFPGSNWARAKNISYGGVLDELRRVAESLSRGLGWREAQAVMFTLTGEVPLVQPIRINEQVVFPVQAASRIVMTIDPTLPPREVAEVYKQHRQRFLGEGRRQREIEAKHLTLAAFSTTRPKDETLAQRMRAWNRKYPKWKYTERTNFGRDVATVRSRLMQPLKGDVAK